MEYSSGFRVLRRPDREIAPSRAPAEPSSASRWLLARARKCSEDPAWRPRGRSIKVKRHGWPDYSTRSRWRFRNSSVPPITAHPTPGMPITRDTLVFFFSLPIKITHFPRLCEPHDAKPARHASEAFLLSSSFGWYHPRTCQLARSALALEISLLRK